MVEYNWRLPSISGSADTIEAGVDHHEGIPFDMAGLFSFSGTNHKLFLNPVTGQPTGG